MSYKSLASGEPKRRKKTPTADESCLSFFYIPKTIQGTALLSWQGASSQLLGPHHGSSCQISAFKVQQLQTVGQLFRTVLLSASEVDPAKEAFQRNTRWARTCPLLPNLCQRQDLSFSSARFSEAVLESFGK